jgi:hypothetical protein
MLLSMGRGEAESHIYPAQLHGNSLYGIIHLYVTNNFNSTVYHTAIQTNQNPQPWAVLNVLSIERQMLVVVLI